MTEIHRQSDSEKFEIPFRDQHDFGVFYIQLRNDNVAFSLRGFHTLAVYRSDFEQLPAASRRMYEEYLAEGRIIRPIPQPGSRRLMRTLEEVEQLAQRLAEKY